MDVALKAFMAAKEALANITLLSPPVINAPTRVMTDASDITVGAVLQQFIQDEWCRMAYFSRKIKPAKTQCSTKARSRTLKREVPLLYNLGYPNFD